MSSRDRFEKLRQEFSSAFEKRKGEHEQTLQKSQENAHVVERVLTNFAVTMNWRLSKPTGYYYWIIEGPGVFIRVDWGFEGARIEILSKPCTHTEPFTVHFHEFSEEKFAQALEDCFKTLHQNHLC